ncbi:glycosyltransferase [Oligella urethralis]|uniref:glycosyltransferase n=1 Tax=Oligella urethralis TaxID=90245 RepID=UPI000E0E7CE5|nr:glycosyltransferase [Oligella urethralis]
MKVIENNKCLILLTNYFPYYKGEEYIEAEILYLAHTFDKVIIIPTMVDDTMVRTRDIPENVDIVLESTPHSLKHKIGYFLQHGKSILFNKTFLRSLKQECGWNPYKWLYALYFESRSVAVFNKVIKGLNKVENISSYRVTLYSYWFYITASVAIKLRELYFKDEAIYLVSRGHGYDINERIKPFSYLPMRSSMLAKIDKLFTVSDEARDRIRKQYSGYADKIETRRLGVVFNGKQLSSRNPFLIVSCSTIRKLKRIDLIISALEKLKIDGLEFQWVHIGDGELKQSLEEEAHRKLGNHRVTFLGRIPNRGIFEFYQENKPSVFINTSSSEGVPVSIMEAQAFSIPVVASNVGGTKEIVFDGVNGYLIKDYSDVDGYYDALKKLILMDSAEYERISIAAYQSYMKLADAKTLYSEFASGLINGLNKHS